MSKPVVHVKLFTSSFHMHKNMNVEIIKLPSDMGTESIIVNGFSFTKNIPTGLRIFLALHKQAYKLPRNNSYGRRLYKEVSTEKS